MLPNQLRDVDSSQDQREPAKNATQLVLDNHRSEHASDGDLPKNASVTTDAKQTAIFGISRYQMEQERLARLQNRKRALPVSPPLVSRKKEPEPSRKAARLQLNGCASSPAPKLCPAPSENDMTAQKLNITEPGTSSKFHHAHAEASKGFHSSSLQFPQGVVKKTWAFGHDRNNDIKIEEVLQKSDLDRAVFSAFQWDVDWLLRKLDLQRTRMVFVMQSKDASTRDQYLQETKDMPFLRLCFPPMPGQVNCMHSKLMLLFHPTYLRIVVPSANLVPYDWGETGTMENSAFIIDLPRRDAETERSESGPTSFAKELIFFLKAMGLDGDIQGKVLEFDFSATSDIAFVHTIGGSHTSEVRDRTGYPGLSMAIRELGLELPDVLELDFAASSIGSLNEDFLRTLYGAAAGKQASTVSTAKLRAPASTGIGEGKVSKGQLIDVASSFRIYFPSLETVKQSTGGLQNAGTICLNEKWYSAVTFPKQCMREYKSKRTGLLSHNKILFARGQRSSENSGPPVNIAWAYIGSANLSESAWGKLVSDRTTKSMKLNCRNWECGVVIPIPRSSLSPDGRELRPGQVVPMDVFSGCVEVPFEHPAEVYGHRKPWFFMSNQR